LNSNCSQEIPPFDPIDQGNEADWDTVGELTERSRSPALAMSRAKLIAAPFVEDPAATEAEEEAPAEATLVDIANILGALTVTVVRSSL
jgi:hypothetical protein